MNASLKFQNLINFRNFPKMYYSPEQKNDLERRAKLSCFGSCLIHMILGSFYSWGNLNVYIVSYFKAINPETYEYLNIDVTAFIFPFMGFFIFLTTPFGIKIGNAVGFSLSCIFFSVLLGLSLFLAAFTENFWLFVLFYAILPSIFMGILSSESIYVVIKYKIERKYVNGLMMLFYGIGTALANFIAFLTINPNNDPAIRILKNDPDLYFSREMVRGVPDFLRVLAIIYVLIGVLGSNFMKLPEFDGFLNDPLVLKHAESEEKFEFVYAQIEIEKDDQKKYYVGLQETTGNSRFYNLKSVLKSWKFYQLFLIVLFCSPFGFFMANYYKIIGMTYFNDDLLFVTIGSISGLINGFARFVMPLLARKIQFKAIFIVLIVLQLAMIPTLNLILDNQSLFGVWTALALFCQGCMYALFPKVTFNTFGKNLYSESYSFMLFSFVLANVMHYGIASIFLDLAGLGNVLWVYFSLSLVSFVLVVLFKEEKNEWQGFE